ncbi:MAG: hypothetical protein GF372_07690 [Candidatus Marinimicrobia bacterium]|nr:hypothetical protein [Candidatus Neomarinimicrobiota bacterium]
MFLNYLKIAWRNAVGHKGYTFVNIVGLAVALAACLLITLFILDELSFDRFHEHADQIYRITFKDKDFGDAPVLPGTAGPRLKQRYPEIKEMTRLVRQETVFRVENSLHKEEQVSI